MPVRASVVKQGNCNSIAGIKRVQSAVQSSNIKQIRAAAQTCRLLARDMIMVIGGWDEGIENFVMNHHRPTGIYQSDVVCI
jgi:hypothetical protein